MKRKSEFLEHAIELYKDEEVFNAGIVDALEYIHNDLTIDELKEYIKFIKHGDFADKLKEIKTLRSQRPIRSWRMMAAGFGNDLYEYKKMLQLQEELVKVWKKQRPFIENRDLGKV